MGERKRKIPEQADENEILTFDQYVGRRIKIARVNGGHSQSELGKLMGITFQQIQKYEWGANKANFERIFDIARIYKLPIDFFIEGYSPEGGSPEAEENMPEDYRGRASTRVVVLYNQLEEAQRKALHELMKALVADQKKAKGNGE